MGPNTYGILNQHSDQWLTTDGVAGDQVYREPCGGVSDPYDQVWYTGLRPNTWPDAYNIQSSGSGLYLDVYNDSPWPGVEIDSWYANGGQNQYFGAN